MKAKLNLLAMRIWHELKRDEAQDLIEYALLIGFISLSVVAAIKPFGEIVFAYYSILKSRINTLPVGK